MDTETILSAVRECVPPSSMMIARRVGVGLRVMEAELLRLKKAGVLKSEVWRGATGQSYNVYYYVVKGVE